MGKEKDYLKIARKFAKQAGLDQKKIKAERDKIDFENRYIKGNVQFFPGAQK
jgi:hypothetical protein